MFVSGSVECMGRSSSGWCATRHQTRPSRDDRLPPPLLCSPLLPTHAYGTAIRLEISSLTPHEVTQVHVRLFCNNSSHFVGRKHSHATNHASHPQRQWQPLNQMQSSVTQSSSTSPIRGNLQLRSFSLPTCSSLFVRKRRNAHLGSIENHALAQQPLL